MSKKYHIAMTSVFCGFLAALAKKIRFRRIRRADTQLAMRQSSRKASSPAGAMCFPRRESDSSPVSPCQA